MASQPGLGVEFLPGAGAFIDPPGAVPNPAATLAALNSNTERAAGLESALADALVQRITAGLTRATGLRNQLEGAVESRLAAQGQKAQGIAGRLMKAANRALGQSYTYAFPYGYQYPTNEEAYARLQQGPGVYFADVAPTAQPVPPVPVGNVPATPGGVPAGSNTGGVPPLGSRPTPTKPMPGLLPGGGPGFVPVVPPAPAPIPPAPPAPAPIAPAPPVGSNGQPPQVPPVLPVQPSPITGDTNPPGTIPSVGGPVGANGQPATCPAGFVPVSSSSYLAGTTSYLPPPPTPFGIQPFQPRTMQGGSGCPQPVSGSFPTAYDPAGNVQNPAVGEMISPWTEPVYFGQPGDMQSQCIDGACLGQPGTTLSLYFPAGFFLVYDPATGQVLAAQGLPPGWEEMGVVPCSDKPAVPPGNVPAGCVPAPPAAQCPAPPQPPCGAPMPGAFPTLGADASDFCKSISDVIQQYQAALPKFSDWVNMGTGPIEQGTIGASIINAITGVDEPVIPGLVRRFGKWVQQSLDNFNQGVNCDPRTLAPVLTYKAIAEFVQRWTAVVPEQVLELLKQVSNYICQSILPGVPEANRAWLANQITDDVWECFCKAAGHHVDEAKAVRDSDRTRPTYPQALTLKNRLAITQDRMDKLARAAGIIDDDDKTDLKNFHNYWPAVGELFKWEQEALFNEETISRFGLDVGFDEAWQDHLKTWADGHQLDYDNARRLYMATNRRPGYSEMVEAVRRLRPGRVDDSLVFTEDDLNTALGQEGYPDYWITRLAKLREHKPTRQDVRQLYDQHIIDEAELRDELQDMGYSSDYADKQVERWQIERNLLDYHKAGYPAAGSLAALYARGELSQSDFQTLAQRVVTYPGQLDDMVQAAQVQEQIENKRLAVQGVKHQFTSGLVDIGTAAGELAAAGMDGDQIARLTQFWQHVKKSTPKQVGASELCRWRKENLIGRVDQATALSRLGYTVEDVDLIVKDCEYQIAKAAEKSQASAQKQATAAATKAAAAQAKAAKAAAKGTKTTSPP